MKRYEVKIVGIGGQGIKMAGVVLGMAATIDGKFASNWPSYGVETRGGPSTSEIVISSEKINYPRVIAADLLVALDQRMLNTYIDDLKPRGVLITDSELVKDVPTRKDITVKRLPITKITEDLGQRLVINMVMLGSLTAIMGIVSNSALIKAIEANVPSSTKKINIEAFEAGMKLSKEE